mmetsp:Transcript_14295/g.39471  ORF Transcript_14295/g.39471 Transcript_14295/m.39471 type:complete len:307 (-) Transcript_14295:1564-2484(-)
MDSKRSTRTSRTWQPSATCRRSGWSWAIMSGKVRLKKKELGTTGEFTAPCMTCRKRAKARSTTSQSDSPRGIVKIRSAHSRYIGSRRLYMDRGSCPWMGARVAVLLAADSKYSTMSSSCRSMKTTPRCSFSKATASGVSTTPPPQATTAPAEAPGARARRKTSSSRRRNSGQPSRSTKERTGSPTSSSSTLSKSTQFFFKAFAAAFASEDLPAPRMPTKTTTSGGCPSSARRPAASRRAAAALAVPDEAPPSVGFAWVADLVSKAAPRCNRRWPQNSGYVLSTHALSVISKPLTTQPRQPKAIATR